MSTDRIERTRREYTDQYVVVDARRPELARFEGYVGQVKTVNMSGRALVEFLDYHRNVGWYDIELDHLKIVDQPAAKSATAEAPVKPGDRTEAAAAKPPARGKGLSPLEMARQQGAAAKPPARGKGLSPLETARQQGAAAKPPAPGKGLSPLEMARQQGAAAKPAPGTAKAGAKSTADILAAARAQKRGGSEQVAATEQHHATPAANSAGPTAAPAQGDEMTTDPPAGETPTPPPEKS